MLAKLESFMKLSRHILTLVALPAIASCARGLNYTDPTAPRFASPVVAEQEAVWSGPHATAAGVIAERSTPDSLRIVTFNVRYAEQTALAIRVLQTSPELRNADIVMLEEMNEDAVAEVAAALGMEYVYYPALLHPVPRKNFGNAVLSRWPIIDDEKLILPSRSMSRGAQRVAVAATILVGHERVRVYAVHLATILEVWFTGQTNQAEAVLEAASDYDRVVVAGDMNSHDNVGAIFTGAGFFWPTRDTGPTTHKLFAVDHVFSRGFTVGGSGAVQDNLGASDHLPVWASLAFSHEQQTAFDHHPASR